MSELREVGFTSISKQNMHIRRRHHPHESNGEIQHVWSVSTGPLTATTRHLQLYKYGEASPAATYRSGLRVLSSRSTLSMPKILVPELKIRDTRMSITEIITSIPSRMFQLLLRYDLSPKHQPNPTIWDTGWDRSQEG